jgi:holo-ACP synthase / triphosphoribosyl-dephospho-CoA synthase
MNNILDSREHRKNIISTYHNPVIVIKANIPGLSKNLSEAYLLVRLFFIELKKVFNVISHQFIDSSDGPYYILELNFVDIIDVKYKLIEIENTYPLGRFIDLDIYDHQIKTSLSRNALHLDDRKCYICEKSARYCSKNQTHDVHILIDLIKNEVYTHLRAKVKQIVIDSMKIELELEYKFGLVTKSSSGSHPDMNYDLMLIAQDAIVPYLLEMFDLAYQKESKINLNEIFEKARDIGKLAETIMLDFTNQINCYKGLIFVLGLFVLSTSFALKNNQRFEDIFENIKIMTKNIDRDFKVNDQTFGKQAYLKYKIKGARGEASQGFPTIKKLIDKYSREEITDQMLRNVLKDIILSTDDTVFLKRAKSYENYINIKKMIENLDVSNINDVIKFTDYAISNHLSFGGSADLLVAFIYVLKIKDLV